MLIDYMKTMCPDLPTILGVVNNLETTYKNSIKEKSCVSCRFNEPREVQEMSSTVVYTYCKFYDGFKSSIDCSRWQQEDENKHYKILYDYIVNMGRIRYGGQQ